MSNKDTYLQVCKERYVPLFWQPWWLDAVCTEWDVALATEKGKVTGVWPYAIESKAGVRLMRNPPLTPYLGPYLPVQPTDNYRQRDSNERKVIAVLLPQLPAAKVWNLELQPGLKQAGVFGNAGLLVQVRQTFLLGLLEDEARLLANMKGNLRRDIAAAEKEMTITNDAAQLGKLYDFQKHTLNKKGKKQYYSFDAMQQLFDACGKNDACALWVASAGEQVLSIIWQVWDAQCSYYFMSAQNPAAQTNKATSALLWHAIRAARGMGHTLFDFEGSMDEGIEGFFRGFGGQRELYMVVKKNESLVWKVKEMIRG